MKKVAIFGTNKNIHATRRIIEELEKRKIKYDFLSHDDIVYSSSETPLHKGKPIDFASYGVAFFRTAGYTVDDVPFSFRLENEIRILSDHLISHNIPFINENIIRSYPFYNKFTQSQIFQIHNIVTPKTFHVNRNTPENILHIMKMHGLNFPIVLKRSAGSQGKSVYLINTEDELKKHLYDRQNINYILQEYIENKEDYRVLFINKKVIGIMKRSSVNGEWRNNFSLGGSVTYYHDEKMEAFVYDICMKIGFDNAGVDIIVYKDKMYVLEINLTPGFEGFEKAINVNVAAEFVSILEEKIRRVEQEL